MPIYFEQKDSFAVFLTRFKAVSKDPVLSSYYDDLVNEENKDKTFAGKVSSQSGMLYPASGSTAISFQQLLDQHKGKVIYVDFWASWCAPCRQEMPKSKALSDSLVREGVVVIFISLDEQASAWEKANRDMGVKTENSFLLLNPRTAALVKELQIEMIPRYLIINRDGKIVNRDAPRPGEKRTMNMIRKLLN